MIGFFATASVGLVLTVTGALTLLAVTVVAVWAFIDAAREKVAGLIAPDFGSQADPDDSETWRIPEWRDDARKAMQPHEFARETTQRGTGGAS